ncbi:MAG TPA: ATP-binding protein [Candidatus Eisenbacteria bacterium]|nr:ATP-binding protein [Candidatus Eisenbacteria bacterium]
MPEPNTLSRTGFVYLISALALFFLHGALLLAGSNHPATPLASNLIQIACPALAGFACLSAARQAENFAKHFWLLFGTAVFGWAIAQTVATYYDSILHASVQEPWPSDMVYFLSMSVPLTILFIDQKRGFERKQWPRLFDLAQVFIIMLAVYLFTFDTPDAWRNGWGTLGQIAWIPETSRDIVLLFSFVLCAVFSKVRPARDLYGRMALFILVYLGGEFPYLYLQATSSLRTGSLWDFAWSVPFLTATVVATLPLPAAATADAASQPVKETPRSARWAWAHVASLIFPIVVLLMAAGIAEKQLFIAATLVILSFSCSVARILFAEQQQQQAAWDLEESNALLKSVFEGTGDALFIKDLGGRYVIVNRTYAELLQLKPEDLQGKTVFELIDLDTARLLTEHDAAVVREGTNKLFEYDVMLHAKRHSFITTKAPHRDAAGKIVGVIGVVRDVTEYRHMEERLRQSQKMEAIGTLAGGVAHDFNNLLMVISGYSSMLADALAPDQKLRGHVDQILKAGERATSLTGQLLAFSRKQTIQPTTLHLNQIVTGIEKLLRRLIGEDIKIFTHLAPDLGTILADAGQMEQVILNLAVNARDAMPKGGELIFETRNVGLGDTMARANNLKPGRYIEFLVKDTGTGMDPGVQKRLFEPFFTTKPTGKGTGLGLSTVYGILKQANGHITFTSQPGRGTTFRIFLPCIASALPASPRSAQRQESLRGRETVLIVEDDASVCELIRSVLDSHGYSVLTAAQPDQAETLLAHPDGQAVDLMVSDVVMPGLSGTELASRLSSKNPRMKVLFMSGYIDDALVRAGIEDKDVAFLQKPFAPITLVRKVREVLDGTLFGGAEER